LRRKPQPGAAAGGTHVEEEGSSWEARSGNLRRWRLAHPNLR
jgi:hypothetical protein